MFVFAGLNKLIAKLERRAEKAEKASPGTKYTLKTRVESSPSSSSPPKDAPVWAVKDDVEKSQVDHQVDPPTHQSDSRTQDQVATTSHSRPVVETPSGPATTTRRRRLLEDEALDQILSSTDSSSVSDID